VIRIRTGGSARDFSGAITDISFLLIIFFLVSAAFVTDSGILLRLPSVQSRPKTLRPEEVLSITLAEGGRYTVDGTDVPVGELGRLMSGRRAALKEPILVLTVGSGVAYQEVLDVLEVGRTVGYSGFTLSTERRNPVGIRIESE
jgi:biopolymer transport protein ExbD